MVVRGLSERLRTLGRRWGKNGDARIQAERETDVDTEYGSVSPFTVKVMDLAPGVRAPLAPLASCLS